MEDDDGGWRMKDASVTFQFTGGRASQAHVAALALGDRRGGTVAHVLTHHLLTKHRPRLTNTHSARLWVPDVVVGDDLPVGHAGILVRQNTVRSSYRWRSLWATEVHRPACPTEDEACGPLQCVSVLKQNNADSQVLLVRGLSVQPLNVLLL